MELTQFKSNVPITISGEMEQLVNQGDIVGAVVDQDGTRSYYLAGLDHGLLRDAGITQVSQLSQLHSMSNQGTVQVVRFEGQTDCIGVLLSDALKRILQNNPATEPLTRKNWRIYKLEDPHSDSPLSGRLNDTGDLIHFSDLTEWFNETMKNGYLTKSQKALNKKSVKISDMPHDKVRSILDKGEGSLDTSKKVEKTDKDIAREQAELYHQGGSLSKPQEEEESFTDMLEGMEFEGLEDFQAAPASSSQAQAVSLDLPDPESFMADQLEAKGKSTPAEQVYFQNNPQFVTWLKQLTIDSLDGLDETSVEYLTEKVQGARQALAERILAFLTRTMKETLRGSEHPETNENLFKEVSLRYDQDVTQAIDAQKETFDSQLADQYDQIQAKEDAEFDAWYQEVQADPRAVFDKDRSESVKQRRAAAYKEVQEEVTAFRKEHIAIFQEWLKEFYADRYAGDNVLAQGEMESYIRTLQDNLNTQVALEQLQTQLRAQAPKEEEVVEETETVDVSENAPENTPAEAEATNEPSPEDQARQEAEAYAQQYIPKEAEVDEETPTEEASVQEAEEKPHFKYRGGGLLG